MRLVVNLVLLGSVLSVGAKPAAAQNCNAPRVLVVLDRSSSMNGIVDGKSKWTIAKSALTTVVNGANSSIEFGLMRFPYQATATKGGHCTAGQVDVEVGAAKASQIAAMLDDPPPSAGNYTPMAQSLAVARDHKLLNDAAHPNHVVLITDGWQWCSSETAAADRKLPIQPVTEMKQGGITVHIVGFGSGVDSETLNQMAIAAGTSTKANCNIQTDLCYHRADSAQQLLSTLNSIVQQVGSEICNGKDDDCDGTVDNNLPSAPLCIKQLGVCKGSQKKCAGAVGYQDCTTADYQAHSSDYQEDETRCDGLDNDCDGVVDEGCADCKDGVDMRPCSGQSVGACKPGVQTCVDGAWSTKCVDEVKPSIETCDGQDNDCNGEIDENLSRSCTTQCGEGVQTCVNGSWATCSAASPESEICDGKDNDCDGVVDGPQALCPEGGVCVNARCESTELPATGGCDCTVSGNDLPLTSLFLGLLGLLLLRRRRNR